MLHFTELFLEFPISSITPTDENVLRAYYLLVNRYENKDTIIQSYIRALVDTPKVVTPLHSELQNLHYHITSNINGHRSLQQPLKNWDVWLVTFLFSRMDSFIVGEWYLQYKKRNLSPNIAVKEFLSNKCI